MLCLDLHLDAVRRLLVLIFTGGLLVILLFVGLLLLLLLGLRPLGLEQLGAADARDAAAGDACHPRNSAHISR